jgi:uncharacterized membrane protein
MSIQLEIRAAVLGFASGSRAVAPIAVESWFVETGRMQGMQLPAKLLRRRPVAYALLLGALGEMGVDQLPFTPERTQRRSVAGRATSGAICGAVLFSSERRQPLVGAAIGAATAILGTYTLFMARRGVASRGLADPIVGLCEDIAVVGASVAALAGGASVPRGRRSWLRKT